MFIFGLLAFLLFIDISYGVSLPSVNCPGIKLTKLGCYKDDQQKPRPLPDLLITDRDKTSPVFSGIKINWKKWDQYMSGLICRCAQKSLSKGYNKMGLQHYGECWSGENSRTLSYARSGPTPFCITWRGKKCSGGLDCIGEDHANFVYTVEKDKQPTAAPSTRPTRPSTTPTPPIDTTPKPSTPQPTTPQPTTPQPTTPQQTTPKKTTTPKQTTPKPSPKPTTSSGTSTAPPPTNPIKPTQSPPYPCTPTFPAGCQQPAQPCAYPTCIPPVVPQTMPAMPYPMNPMIGCGKSKIPGCIKEHKVEKELKVPSLDDDDDIRK